MGEGGTLVGERESHGSAGIDSGEGKVPYFIHALAPGGSSKETKKEEMVGEDTRTLSSIYINTHIYIIYILCSYVYMYIIFL